MCLAGSYLTQLQRLTDEISRDRAKLSELNSQLDRDISAIYHEIEKMDLTPDNAYHICALLQSTLRKRRVVKDEFARMNSITDLIDSNRNRVENAQKRYEKAAASSEKVRQSLNVTLTIHDIGGISL